MGLKWLKWASKSETKLKLCSVNGPQMAQMGLKSALFLNRAFTGRSHSRLPALCAQPRTCLLARFPARNRALSFLYTTKSSGGAGARPLRVDTPAPLFIPLRCLVTYIAPPAPFSPGMGRRAWNQGVKPARRPYPLTNYSLPLLPAFLLHFYALIQFPEILLYFSNFLLHVKFTSS